MPGLDIDQLLKGLQAFFHGYTQIVPSPKPDDKPYRTAKTVLFHLTEHMGSEILDHLSLVPEQSRVSLYVRKTLAKKGLSGEGGKGGEGTDGGEGGKVLKESRNKKAAEQQSAFLNEALSLKDLVLLGEIIDKLTPATEHQGLKELYSFQLAHPDVDVPSLFKTHGAFYYTYIVKGLQLMKEEKQAMDNGETPAPFNPELLASDFFLQAKKRSKELREKTAQLLNIDLDKEERVRSAPVAKVVVQPQVLPLQDENVPSQPTLPPPEMTTKKSAVSSAMSKTVNRPRPPEDFRRRLEKLKGQK